MGTIFIIVAILFTVFILYLLLSNNSDELTSPFTATTTNETMNSASGSVSGSEEMVDFSNNFEIDKKAGNK